MPELREPGGGTIPRQRGAASLRALLLVATGVVLVAALALGYRVLTRRSHPSVPEPRAYVTLTSPRGDLIEPPREFTWVPIPGALRYRVKIADEDALWPMFLKTTNRPPVVLDDRESSALTPGRVHVWEVEALGKDGNPIAKGAVQFRVVPPAPPGA